MFSVSISVYIRHTPGSVNASESVYFVCVRACVRACVRVCVYGVRVCFCEVCVSACAGVNVHAHVFMHVGFVLSPCMLLLDMNSSKLII